MGMRAFYGFLIILLFVTTPVFAQQQMSTNDIVSKLQTDLDLSPDQVFHITPIIEKYRVEFHDLQQSIDEGTINQSAIDSQWQGIEAAETQELSQYLKPDQLSQWIGIQSQIYQQTDKDNANGNAEEDQYTNLPKANSPQN